jgi:multisubunit Na+/H+ antiporter MnhG subunit
MALVTYTLLSALASGLQSRFHPEVLGYSLSKALLVVVGEFCAIKLGCYLLDVRGSGASGVELIGYGGYKFVGYAFFFLLLLFFVPLPTFLVFHLLSIPLSFHFLKRAVNQREVEADIQNHRHGPTRFPKSRSSNFNPSIHLRILRKRLFPRKSRFESGRHS